MKAIFPAGLYTLRAAFRGRGFDIRPVGGCVRDSLAGVCPKDFDLCTDANPEEQRTIYVEDQVRHIATGLDHGTWTVVIDHDTYEITSLRTETDHDGRWAKVSYTRDWEGDLARRDLTINAMSMSFEGELFDPFGGAVDLVNGVVRFVGNPDERMREDYLRILRYFRFLGRFGTLDKMDVTTGGAVRRNAKGLAKISRERVWAEMAKIMAGPLGPDLIDEIHALGVGPQIDLPYRPSERVRTAYAATRNPVTLLAAYVGDVVVMKKLAEDWKLSVVDRQMGLFIAERVGQFMDHKTAKFLVAHDEQPKEWVHQLLLAQGQIERAGEFDAWPVPVFPVKGADLLANGMPPGPKIGAQLRHLRAIWADANFLPDRDTLLER